MRSSTSTVSGRKSTSRRLPATAVARTIVSPWRTTTAPEACLAILPVSNEISLPAISTETRVTASLLIFTAFLFRPSVGGPILFSHFPNGRSLADDAAQRARAAARGLRPARQASAAAQRRSGGRGGPKAAARPSRSSSRPAARPARAPGSSSARRRPASRSRARAAGKPPACSTPKARARRALGLEVRELLAADAELLPERAPAPRCESQETPYRRRRPAGRSSPQHRLVELQLVGADGAEGERVEDQHRAPARAGPAR